MDGVNMVTVWIVLLVIFLVAEVLTAGALVSIWFCFGSGAALVCTLLGGNLLMQIILFLVVSIILLLLTKPFIKRFMKPKEQRINADRIVGMKGIVCEEIDNLKGQGRIKVDGKTWTARNTVSDEIIADGTEVIIDHIEGVKAVVHKIN